MRESYEPKDHLILKGKAYHHVARVTRMEPKDKVFLVFSGQIAVIVGITKITEGVVYLKEIKKEESQGELPNSITITSGYPKGKKLDWAIQKPTELGAQVFIGFPVSASAIRWDAKKRMKRQQRLEEIIQEAAE